MYGILEILSIGALTVTLTATVLYLAVMIFANYWKTYELIFVMIVHCLKFQELYLEHSGKNIKNIHILSFSLNIYWNTTFLIAAVLLGYWKTTV